MASKPPPARRPQAHQVGDNRQRGVRRLPRRHNRSSAGRPRIPRRRSGAQRRLRDHGPSRHGAARDRGSLRRPPRLHLCGAATRSDRHSRGEHFAPNRAPDLEPSGADASSRGLHRPLEAVLISAWVLTGRSWCCSDARSTSPRATDGVLARPKHAHRRRSVTSRMAADPMRTRHGFTCALTADLGRLWIGCCRERARTRSSTDGTTWRYCPAALRMSPWPTERVAGELEAH
jgi:hypothetical protein